MLGDLGGGVVFVSRQRQQSCSRPTSLNRHPDSAALPQAVIAILEKTVAREN